jgi:hypothetical protein
MNMTKILFLDLDGVLNPEVGEDAFVSHEDVLRVHARMKRIHRKDVRKRLSWIHPELVAKLNRLLASAGAQVVVSSSWREHHTLEELQIILECRGFTGTLIGMTPVIKSSRFGEYTPRGNEISAWLKGHPEVTSYVILDDKDDMGPHLSRLVQTDLFVGLTYGDVERAVALLSKPQPLSLRPAR